MINRLNRFHGYGSLRLVYRQGQTARGPLLSVKSRPNPRRGSYRLAVVVSRKVSKSAVTRNRIRRRLYEIVRQMSGQITEPVDIVISVYHDTVADEKPLVLERQVRKQFKEAGIIKKPPSA